MHVLSKNQELLYPEKGEWRREPWQISRGLKTKRKIPTPGGLGLGYLVCLGAPRRGGGLATLVSRRLLAGAGVPQVGRPDHGCLLTVRVLESAPICVANLHLVPSNVRAERQAICVEAAAAVGGVGFLLRSICGDLNATMSRSWLPDALRPG